MGSFREEFIFPLINGKEQLYFCGNSLGLQPKSVIKHLEQELKDWGNLGVEGHFKGTFLGFLTIEIHRFK